MEDVKIKISALWVAAMFSWVYGDLLRVYSGDFVAGELIGGIQLTQEMWLGAAILMIIPGAMIFLSLTLKDKMNRRVNVILGLFYTGFNLVGLPSYASAYDQFLIIVGIVFTALIVWYAYKWKLVIDKPNM